MSKAFFYLEKYGPVVLGVLTLGVCIWYRSELLKLVQEKTINLENLYSAIFDWSSIQTGFLFSVYGYVASKTDGFLAEIKDSRSMSAFRKYTSRAMFIGFILTVVTIPLIVVDFDISTNFRFLLVSIWFALFVWAFAGFLRVAVNFGRIVSVRDNSAIGG
tara:strand:- start:146 stop:625 length:480 start_codon:yes stop_codon:yes gene_type:complete